MNTLTYQADFSKRDAEQGTDKMFVERWSPRSFKKHTISEEDRRIIFDAARWSPSAYGEQPWRFLVSTEETFEKFFATLVEMNQGWAKDASLLGFIIAKNNIEHNGAENAWAKFDCGFAWAALTFQANKLGLHTHAMAGFVADKFYESFDVDKSTYTAVVGFAIGKLDMPDKLPEAIKGREYPSERKPLTDLYFSGNVSLK